MISYAEANERQSQIDAQVLKLNVMISEAVNAGLIVSGNLQHISTLSEDYPIVEIVVYVKPSDINIS